MLTLISLLLAMTTAPTLAPLGLAFPSSEGNLYIYHVGHASLVLTWKGKVIHVDPYSEQADYATLPKADLILITHEHYDHLDKSAIAKIKKRSTKIIASKLAALELQGAQSLANGDGASWEDLRIDAVPAYNRVHKRDDGLPFHAKGAGNGYVLSFANLRLYVAGDTEDIDEMGKLENIDIAFLPKNLPYTMTDEMFLRAAKMFRPKTLYAYHYFELDHFDQLAQELKKSGIALLMRNEK
ncbi:MAG: MBL fold metallo-hydrolase [Prevotellaceae bacterium]|jgi:L-ascorbate metabolism protein UlaG (beta-lactamase superfamily)|nr:MBL fold metallo-hydrolase [Prevotellaceae bacterium]